MTRVQKERFFNEEEYLRLKDVYILDEEKLKLADKDMPVLHPWFPLYPHNGYPLMSMTIQELPILTRSRMVNI